MRGTRQVVWFAVGLATLALGCDGGQKNETAEVITVRADGPVENSLDNLFSESLREQLRTDQSISLTSVVAGSAPSGGPSALHGVGTLITLEAMLYKMLSGATAKPKSDDQHHKIQKHVLERFVERMSPLRLFPTPPAELHVPAEPVGRHRLLTEPPVGGR